jgi:toluene monooxygenase system ferredoxin subunit
VLLTRVDGSFVAFPPFCPHMAEPLEISGLCADGMLTCTKHIWQWDLASGEPRGEAERALLYYPVRLDGNDLWIDFEHELRYEYDD